MWEKKKHFPPVSFSSSKSPPAPRCCVELAVSHTPDKGTLKKKKNKKNRRGSRAHAWITQAGMHSVHPHCHGAPRTLQNPLASPPCCPKPALQQPQCPGSCSGAPRPHAVVPRISRGSALAAVAPSRTHIPSLPGHPISRRCCRHRLMLKLAWCLRASPSADFGVQHPPLFWGILPPLPQAALKKDEIPPAGMLPGLVGAACDLGIRGKHPPLVQEDTRKFKCDPGQLGSPGPRISSILGQDQG